MYVGMVRITVGVYPNLAYNYYYTALQAHLMQCKYVHNAFTMDALSKVSPIFSLCFPRYL